MISAEWNDLAFKVSKHAKMIPKRISSVLLILKLDRFADML